MKKKMVLSILAFLLLFSSVPLFYDTKTVDAVGTTKYFKYNQYQAVPSNIWTVDWIFNGYYIGSSYNLYPSFSLDSNGYFVGSGDIFDLQGNGDTRIGYKNQDTRPDIDNNGMRILKFHGTGNVDEDDNPIFKYYFGYVRQTMKKGKFVQEVIAKDGAYPINGYNETDGFFYERSEQAEINENVLFYYEKYHGQVWKKESSGSEWEKSGKSSADRINRYPIYGSNEKVDYGYLSGGEAEYYNGKLQAKVYDNFQIIKKNFHGFITYEYSLSGAHYIDKNSRLSGDQWWGSNNTPFPTYSIYSGGGYVDYFIVWNNGYEFTNSSSATGRHLPFQYYVYKFKEKGDYITTIKAPIGSYPDNGIASDGYWYVRKDMASKPPSLTLITDDLRIIPLKGQSSFSIEGYVFDEENDPITITINIAGIKKSTEIMDTNTPQRFNIPFDVVENNIPAGVHTVDIKYSDKVFNLSDTTITLTVPKLISNNIYVLVDELLFFNPVYEDYEKDPIYGDQYRYTHDPFFFENSLGQIDDSGIWRTNAYESFSKVGHYQVQYRAKDNPVGVENQFGDYRLWSSPTSVLNFFVHRKPIADFNINLSQTSSSTYAVNIINRGYDLDHLSKSSHGIAATEYQWKLDQDATWTAGLPTQVQTGDILLIWQRVKDLEGVWSDPITKEIDTNHLQPPVAQFTVIPNPVRPKANLIYNDTSYDPNGLALTDRAWRYRELPSGTWSIPSSTPPSSFNQARKTYEIELKVKNSVGLWSAPFSQTVQTVNTPPVADFTISPSFIWEGDQVQINGHGSDAEGDPLTYRYEITRVDGSKYMVLQKDFSIDTFNVPPGTWQVKLIVNDGYDDSLPVTKSFSTNPISIDGFVSHTERWNENRIKYNQSKTGTDDSPRTYDVFFPGEKFVLKANTVGDVDRVDVQIVGTSYYTVLQHQSGDMFNSVWTGDLWNEEMLKWKEKDVTFRFTLTVTNGTQKVDDVIVKIVPDEYWRQHNTF